MKVSLKKKKRQYETLHNQKQLLFRSVYVAFAKFKLLFHGPAWSHNTLISFFFVC